jgi:hypothetical protein
LPLVRRQELGWRRIQVLRVGVVAGAEVLVLCGAVGEQCQMITRMVRTTTTRALSLPWRLTIRGRYSVRAAAALASPSIPLRWSCPRRSCRSGSQPGLDGARGQFGSRHEAAVGKPGHIKADLGNDRLGAVVPDAGDLVQPGHDRQRGCVLALADLRPCGAVRVDALDGGDGRDQFLDPDGEPGDLAGQLVNLRQQPRRCLPCHMATLWRASMAIRRARHRGNVAGAGP